MPAPPSPALKVIVNFSGDAEYPTFGLAVDSQGNLFGTADSNAAAGGSIFEVTKTNGVYSSTPTTLVPDQGGALIIDSQGNLFGYSGALSENSDVIFELQKNTTGYASTAKILADASGYPTILMDPSGNLFVINSDGDATSNGAIEEIVKTPTSYNPTVSVLSNVPLTIGQPLSGLSMDATGDLFGTTNGLYDPTTDAPINGGSVYELMKTATGYSSTLEMLATFSVDSALYGGVIVDGNGDLIGANYLGGASGDGYIFEIEKTATGYNSTPVTLSSFNGADGKFPYASLIEDSAGDIFGTTTGGGANNDGTVFEIKKTGSSYSVPITLGNFDASYGYVSLSPLVADSSGNLFGTSLLGFGAGGTVFEVTNSGYIGINTFQQVSAASSGPLKGQYLWSNAANWTAGTIPANNDSVATSSYGYDDLSSLSLTSLTETGGGSVMVTGGKLSIGTLIGPGSLKAGFVSSSTQVTVTIGDITGSGGYYGAAAPAARFVDNAASDPGATYEATNGGTILLSAAPAASSKLFFSAVNNDGIITGSTIALEHPGAITSAALENVGQGDVLELPGSSVDNVSFGATSLSVTTNTGTYNFNDVTYENSVRGYTSAVDPETGLVAITFSKSATFQYVDAATSGPYKGYYLWSDPKNWTDGVVPVNGDSVAVGGSKAQTFQSALDDIPLLSLTTLTIQGDGGTRPYVYVPTNLTVSSLDIADGAVLIADTQDFGQAIASLTIDSMASDGGNSYLAAIGSGAIVNDLATTDGNNQFEIANGAKLLFHAPPSTAQDFDFSVSPYQIGTGSTLAFYNPAAVNVDGEFFLGHDLVGNTIELPGTSVSAVIGDDNTGSLRITTNVGAYYFAQTIFGSPYTYSTFNDPTTGLVAIRFAPSVPDKFQYVDAATGGPYKGYYLWSDPKNWADGIVPVNGNAVEIGGSKAQTFQYALDDIPILSLTALTIQDDGGNPPTVYVPTNLTVNSLEISGGGDLIADTQDFGQATASLTIDIMASDGGNSQLVAVGSGAIVNDLATTDGNNQFYIQNDAKLLFHAPPGTAQDFDFSFYPQLGAGSTLAFYNPAAVNGDGEFFLGGNLVGNTIELPGTSVSAVVGDDSTGSLQITTNVGAYYFAQTVFGSPYTYSTFNDPTTGLVAISFAPSVPDKFQYVDAATSGPYQGYYLWSDSKNWTDGVVPVNGDAVDIASSSAQPIDDISSLILSSLTLASAVDVSVRGNLVVNYASFGTNAFFGLSGDNGVIENHGTIAGLIETNETVSINQLIGADARVGADNPEARLDLLGATDPGEQYFIVDGGTLLLTAPPNAASTFSIGFLEGYEGGGTLALANPQPVTDSKIDGIGVGIVLELPGSSVSNVTIGPSLNSAPSTISVTTNAGTYKFDDVFYDSYSPPIAYSAAPDPTTGLVAITFTAGPSVTTDFQSVDFQSIYSGRNGGYFWSDSLNWTNEVPSVGDSVILPAGSKNAVSSSVDDLTNLNLNLLSQSIFSTVELFDDLTVQTLNNNGTILLDSPYMLTVTGDVTGTGVIIDDPSTITLDGSVSSGQTISFTGSSNVLNLADPEEFGGTISGFAPGDSLNLLNLSPNSITGQTFANDVLTLDETKGDIQLTFVDTVISPGASFALNFAGSGTQITENTPCFAAGTRILTPGGEVAVEHLFPGDLVITNEGEDASVIWIGHRTIDLTRHPHPEHAQPIRIAADAFADGVPGRDLVLSPDHALHLQGHLIPAKALTNKTNIVQLNRRSVTYYHIELAEHSIIFAENTAVETYLETGNRGAFENGGGALSLHPDFATIDFQAMREAKSCAPFAEAGPAVNKARLGVLNRVYGRQDQASSRKYCATSSSRY